MVDLSSNNNNHQHEANEDEISLIDIIITLGEEKKFILKMTSFVTLIAISISLLITPIYSAKTVVLPPQSQQSSSISYLTALAGLSGSSGVPSVRSQDEMYVSFMGSDRFLNALIERFHLLDKYQTKTLVETRAQLKNKSKIITDKKSGLIAIEFEDEDPKFAAELANAYVQELRNMLDMLAVTDAQQRRLFLESQIIKVQENLLFAENSFRKAKEKSGLDITSVIAELGVRASAELRGQILAREIMLEGLSHFATKQNPDVQRIASELSAERAKLKSLELGSGQVVSTAFQGEAVKAYREMKTKEVMLEVLTKQFELARIDEAKEGPLIQVVDIATPPELRSKPKRTLIVLASAFAGLFLSIIFAFLKVRILNMIQTAHAQGQVRVLKKAWSWRT